MYVTQETLVQGHLPTHYVRLLQGSSPLRPRRDAWYLKKIVGEPFGTTYTKGQIEQSGLRTQCSSHPAGSRACTRSSATDARNTMPSPLFAASFSLMSHRLGRGAPAKGQP